ncbi:MAG: hypothetical protein ACKOUT_08035 [Novosphingobium sp.]
MLNWRLALLAFAMSLWTQPALAQQADAPQEQAAESSADEIAEPVGPINLSVTATRKRRACSGLGPNGEIQVCGKDDGADVRVPDDEARTDDGLPRAPEVGPPSCKKTGNKGCIGFGGVPPPVYYIDVKAIPLPPKGSDAEKVAKGEIRDR